MQLDPAQPVGEQEPGSTSPTFAELIGNAGGLWNGVGLLWQENYSVAGGSCTAMGGLMTRIFRLCVCNRLRSSDAPM